MTSSIAITVVPMSLNEEIQRLVHWQLGDHRIRDGFPVSCPPPYSDMGQMRAVGKAAVEQALRDDYDVAKYQPTKTELESRWPSVESGLSTGIKSYGGVLQGRYVVMLTRYGTGGSYNPRDNSVTLNGVVDMFGRSLEEVLAHEITHLSVNHWIMKYNIGQLEKERIIDLTMAQMGFPARQQTLPMKNDEIERSFANNYPAMETAIAEIAQIQGT